MGKNKNKKQSIPDEAHLLLPQYATNTAIVDTHTHLVSTFAQYQNKYKGGKYETIYDFVRGLYQGRKVDSIVDVWCEAPVQTIWRELADSAQRRDEQWDGIQYWFVMG
jgi:TatD DNase family protein